MQHFSFKVFLICILLPPLLYVFTLQALENHMRERYTREIEEIYTGDTRSLFDGSIPLKNAISRNIDNYLRESRLINWGVKANVQVTTKQDTILYPSAFEKEDSLEMPDPLKTAADNYKLMNEGLVVRMDVKLEHNRLLSNAILSFYILASILVLYSYYRAGAHKARQDDMERAGEIDRLQELERKRIDRLKALEREKISLSSEIRQTKRTLEDEKIRASRNEDELIADIVSLEDKLEKNLALQKDQQAQIDALKDQIKRSEGGKPTVMAADSTLKRFNALYKNISMHKRAITGYNDLVDDMKIKSEEIIHQLNDDPGLVPIKRKVFGRKGRETVLEVIFAYNGRLYYRNKKGNKIEVLAIGTKNTQAKDLEFLNNL
jgi:hypothetical protein